MDPHRLRPLAPGWPPRPRPLRLLPLSVGRLRPLLDLAARPAGRHRGVLMPPVASYTAVLLTDTATPAWHDSHRELPFVFVGSAAAASGGLGMVTTPADQTGPARRLAVAGAAVELVVEHRMEHSMGLSAETLHDGQPGRMMQGEQGSSPRGGALGAAVLGAQPDRGRVVRAGADGRLGLHPVRRLRGRSGVGQGPKYTVVPQRERLDDVDAAGGQTHDSDRRPARYAGKDPTPGPEESELDMSESTASHHDAAHRDQRPLGPGCCAALLLQLSHRRGLRVERLQPRRCRARRPFKLSKAEATLPFEVAIGMIFIGTFVGGRIQDRRGPRMVAMTGG